MRREYGSLSLRPLPVSEPLVGIRSTRPGSERYRAFVYLYIPSHIEGSLRVCLSVRRLALHHITDEAVKPFAVYLFPQCKDLGSYLFYF